MIKHTTNRQLWDSWVVIENYKKLPTVSQSVSDFEGEHLLGYCYIDHNVGVTCDVLALFIRKDNQLILTTNLVERKVRVLLRYDTFANEDFRAETETFANQLGIFKPDYYTHYTKSNLIHFRNSEEFDEFRANGFPDDIQIYLLPKKETEQTEIVWGRVEEYDIEKRVGMATMLVKPHQDFGIRQNDIFSFQLIRFENKFYPIGILNK